MRQEKQITETKYFNALKEAKNDIELNTFDVRLWKLKFKLASVTNVTLKNLGIIKNLGTKRYPSFEWNSKIPVTMLLAKKVILENNKQRMAYKDAKSNTPLKPIAKPIAKPIVNSGPVIRFFNC